MTVLIIYFNKMMKTIYLLSVQKQNSCPNIEQLGPRGGNLPRTNKSLELRLIPQNGLQNDPKTSPRAPIQHVFHILGLNQIWDFSELWL